MELTLNSFFVTSRAGHLVKLSRVGSLHRP